MNLTDSRRQSLSVQACSHEKVLELSHVKQWGEFFLITQFYPRFCIISMTTSGTRLPCVQQLSKPLFSRMTLPITNTEPSELAITAVLWMATCLLLHCKDHSQCIWAAGLFMLNISFQAAGSAPLNPPHCVRLCTYIILHSVTQIFNRETGKLQL